MLVPHNSRTIHILEQDFLHPHFKIQLDEKGSEAMGCQLDAIMYQKTTA